MKVTRDVLWLWAGLLLVAGGSNIVWADTVWAETKVYRWVDAQGKVSFSDRPPETTTGQYLEPPRQVDAEGPPLQEHSTDTQRRLDENRRWFEQRAKERQADEALRARVRAREARADQQWQQQCDRAQQQLEQAERQYEVRRRTWLKAANKNRLKHQVETRRAEVKRRCSL